MPRPRQRSAQRIRYDYCCNAVARTLCALYNQRVFTKVHRPTFGDPFDRLTLTYKRFFLDAARDCLDLGADPGDYIEAQFRAFEIYGRGKRRQRLPQPNQLFGLGAQARFAEYVHNRRENDRRDADQVEAVIPEFSREERKLRGLCRRMLLPEADVLARVPAEFTVRFLQHKGIWNLVEAAYRAATKERT